MAAADTNPGYEDGEGGFFQGDILKRSVSGVALGGFGLILLAACLTYNPGDTTWDTAGLTESGGMAASLRAGLANVFLQSWGWGAAVLAVLIAVWGWRGIFFPQPQTRRWQSATNLLLITLTTVFSSAALSAAPIPATWPFATGMGGVFGDKVFFGLSGFLEAFRIPLAGGFAATISVLLAGLFGGIFLRIRGAYIMDIADAFGLVWATLRVWFDTAWAKIQTSYDKDRDDARPVKAWLDTAELSDPEPASEFTDGGARIIDVKPPKPAPSAEETVAPAATAKAAKPKAKPGKKPKFKFPKGAGFVLPELDLLKTPPPRIGAQDEGQLQRNAEELAGVLEDFGVKGDIVGVSPGPVVTLYEFEPAPGVKSSRVINLADDIARSMSAISARVAVVPGRNAIGIELPNRRRETVWLKTMLSSKEFAETEYELPLLMGENIGGKPFIANLAKMPHLLVAGTTGSGKSVGVNAMILSLMYRLSPEECKFIMIDPKMLELSIYDGAPHLLAPVVTEPKKAVVALKWTVREMESRYRKMSKLGVRNVAGYNERVAAAIKSGETLSRTVQTGYDKESGEPIYETEEIIAEPMPFIVVIIDEMADLMMVAGKEIEGAVQRLAQMARAAGIHMIMATQRPSVDVITGTIKANFPTRVSFQVTSKIDSRTILGEQGAEQLLGMGDMLFMAGGGRTVRLHGPFVSDNEVETVAAFVKAQGTPAYLDDITRDDEDEDSVEDMMNGNTGDETFDKAVAIVASDRKCSTSYIQRRLSIGYNRAANIVEKMEAAGMIGPAGAGGKREIFLPEHQEY